MWPGFDPESLLIEDMEICPKLERLKVDGLIVDAVIAARLAFYVGDVTTRQ